VNHATTEITKPAFGNFNFCKPRIGGFYSRGAIKNSGHFAANIIHWQKPLKLWEANQNRVGMAIALMDSVGLNKADCQQPALGFILPAPAGGSTS